MATIINASTSAGLIQTADTLGTLQLQSNGVTQQTIDSTGAYGQLKSGTAQASTSGTSIDFTGIPSWVKRITVIYQAVSTNAAGASPLLVQIGSGSITSTGYVSYSGVYESTNTSVSSSSTVGFVISGANGNSSTFTGHQVLTLISGNIWVSSHNSGGLDGSSVAIIRNGGGYSPNLSGTLDRVRITTVNGTDTFDAGSINILYEG